MEYDLESFDWVKAQQALIKGQSVLLKLPKEVEGATDLTLLFWHARLQWKPFSPAQGMRENIEIYHLFSCIWNISSIIKAKRKYPKLKYVKNIFKAGVGVNYKNTGSSEWAEYSFFPKTDFSSEWDHVA